MRSFCFELEEPDDLLELEEADEKLDRKWRCFGLKELELPLPNLFALLNWRLETKFTSGSSSEKAGVYWSGSSGCCC